MLNACMCIYKSYSDAIQKRQFINNSITRSTPGVGFGCPGPGAVLDALLPVTVTISSDFQDLRTRGQCYARGLTYRSLPGGGYLLTSVYYSSLQARWNSIQSRSHTIANGYLERQYNYPIRRHQQYYYLLLGFPSVNAFRPPPLPAPLLWLTWIPSAPPHNLNLCYSPAFPRPFSIRYVNLAHADGSQCGEYS